VKNILPNVTAQSSCQSPGSEQAYINKGPSIIRHSRLQCQMERMAPREYLVMPVKRKDQRKKLISHDAIL
jgi:hypothetical protein